MTFFASERKAIGQTFKTEWVVGVDPRTPIAYPNKAFTPPDSAWVRLAIVNGETLRLSLGPNGEHRWAGIVYVQVFVPQGSGDGEARSLADEAAKIFRDRALATDDGGSITFRSPSIQQIGPDGRWWQLNVICPYQRDFIDQ